MKTILKFITNKIMSRKINIILILTVLTLFSFHALYAQEISVSGTVKDKAGNAIPGVTIVEKGTTNGTVSNVSGNYTIRVAGSSSVLIYSFVGLKTQEIEVGQNQNIDIVLEEDFAGIDEVVVVGYGTQRRGNITGAIASVNTEVIKDRPIQNIEDALQGQVTGLSISSTGGQPGAATKMNIRGINSMAGSSQPLIVVDGFPLNDVNTSGGGAGGEVYSAQMGALSYINPDDIESIEVLKDASATAIYGNRGANGVIMITTKKGMRGESGITFNTYMGIQEMKNRINVMEFGDWYKYAQLKNPQNRLFTAEDGTPYVFEDPDAMNINWQDEIYRRGIIQNHSLSLQGKTDKTSYTLSSSYNQNKSVLIETDFKKFTSRFSLDHQFSDKVMVGGNLNFSNIVYNGTVTDGREGTAAGVVLRGLIASPFRMDNNTAARFRRAGVPNIILEDFKRNSLSAPDNVAANTDLDKIINRTIGNFYANFQILDWLAFRTTAGIDFYNLKSKQFYSSKTPSGFLDSGIALQTSRNARSVVNENYFTLTESLGAHNIKFVTGFSVQESVSEYYSAKSTGFENELLGYNALSLGTNFEANSSVGKRFLASYLARANYSFDDRYLLTASYRRDGSSIFLENKWGDFYSGAFAWNVKNESFLKDSEKISNLKIRTSIGQVGNQNVPVQGALLDGEISDYTFDGEYYTGVSASTLENKDLSWETSQQINTGIDIGFFNNKLNIVADYYTTNTKDLLLFTPVSISSGFEFGWFNVGELKNTGFEFSANYELNTNAGFTWNTTLNVTNSKNEILALGRDAEPIYIDVNFDTKVVDEVILEVGGSINNIFGYQTDGIYTDADFDSNGDMLPNIPNEGKGEIAGDLRFKDLSGPDGTPDGFIDGFDRTVIGNTLPDLYGSWTNNFSFKGFDLDIIFQYSYGNEVFNATRTRTSTFLGGGNQTDEWIDSYINNPQSTQYSRVSTSVPSDNFVEDGSFVRLQTLRFGYNFPKKWAEKVKAKNVKLYVSGSNLALWTKYSGYDPEVTTNQVDGRYSFVQGFDYGGFPRAKTFIVGANIQF